MDINSKAFGIAVGITAAFLWSAYSFGVFCLVFLATLLFDIDGSSASSEFAGAIYDYLGQLVLIVSVSGAVGWVIAEIYNSLYGLFDIRLK